MFFIINVLFFLKNIFNAIENGDHLTIRHVNKDNAGNYTCFAGNQYGNDSGVITLNVIGKLTHTHTHTHTHTGNYTCFAGNQYGNDSGVITLNVIGKLTHTHTHTHTRETTRVLQGISTAMIQG